MSSSIFPALGLYWFANVDPTAGAGVSAPFGQLLIRTDVASLWWKSGTMNTDWTQLGSTGGLVAVAHDATLTGDGTGGSPLSVVPPTVAHDTTLTGDGTLGSPLSVVNAGNPQRFLYVATGAEGSSFNVPLPAARADANYIALVNLASSPAGGLYLVVAPVAGYAVNQVQLQTSVPVTAGDTFIISVGGLT